MSDLISRQALCEYALNQKDKSVTPNDIMRFPSAQPEPSQAARDIATILENEKDMRVIKKNAESESCADTISRKAAIDAHFEYCNRHPDAEFPVWSFKILEDLPSEQPTIYGYNVEHLEMIARVLQKENLPPERVIEMLTDIGRIVAIVRDEFEETLRKAVEQCRT